MKKPSKKDNKSYMRKQRRRQFRTNGGHITGSEKAVAGIWVQTIGQILELAGGNGRTILSH